MSSVIQLFKQVVQRRENYLAIAGATESLTYRALQDRALQVADFLVSRQVPPGSVIAVLSEEPINTIVTMLGILEAGCVFCPLHRNQPPKRLKSIVEQIAPDWFFAQAELVPFALEALSQSGGSAALELIEACSREQSSSVAWKNDNVLAPFQEYRARLVADGFCYLCFPSASVRRVSAVAGCHKGLSHFIRWEMETFQLGESSRLALLSPPHLDTFLQEVLVALCAGGTLCIPECREIPFAPESFVAWLNSAKVTFFHCQSDLLRALSQASRRCDYSGALRHVIVSGQRLLPEEVRKWLDLWGADVTIARFHGPAETTVAKFCHWIKPEDTKRRLVPVGKPIKGSQALILDENKEVCPQGLIGEIYIRTPFRTLGYYGDDQATKQHFVRNPLSDDPADLVFRTGDMGRILDDGNFEVVGRKDRRVIVRGMQIELDEIEACLGKHADVREGAVKEWEDTAGERCLCAYFVSEHPVGLSGLRDFLKTDLPEEMVPILFRRLEELPRKLNGRIDVNALPKPLPGEIRQLSRSTAAKLSEREIDRGSQTAGAAELADSTPLQFPADWPRSLVHSFRAASQSSPLPRALVERLRRLGEAKGRSFGLILLAAFQVLIVRHAGETVVAIVVSGLELNASLDAAEGKIADGCTYVQTDLSENPTFTQALELVRNVIPTTAERHVRFPARDAEGANTPEHGKRMGASLRLSLQWSSDQPVPEKLLDAGDCPEQFDLHLHVGKEEDSLALALHYNADLFSPIRVEEILAQYQGLLEQIADNPDKRIDQYTLLTASAVKRLPDPTQPLATEWFGAVHEHFADQAQRFPERLAVVSHDAVWSYGELQARSNRVANLLLGTGVQPEEVVAIYGHHSACLVSALLGVNKAGAAFVLLDPDYPEERLITCLRLAAPRAWIQIYSAGPVPKNVSDFLAGMSLRCLLELSATDDSTSAADGIAAPVVEVKPDQLAYLAFTSGTTGQPKVVAGTHRPLSHFLRWHASTFGLGPTDRFSFLSGLSHDPALRDVFTPLWLGAVLCIPDLDDLSATRLVRWMKQSAITVSHLTPAMAQLLTSETVQSRSRLESLRYVFFGGDVLSGAHVEKMRELAPQATCVNFYGATETPQGMAWFVVPDKTALTTQDYKANLGCFVPLGRGIDDVQLLVLNSAQRLAGVGEFGEIHIRTPYLTRGYVGDADLTRQRFVVNPFTGHEEDRIYRTGDWGRYLPDGTVAFAGRLDDQVKIRGFRVELREIESVLCQDPQVEAAVVQLWTDEKTDEKSLVAYIVPKPNLDLNTQVLRIFTAQMLADYMVPTAFVRIESLPLTPNGKVNRHALPKPDRDRQASNLDYAEPRTPLEQSLARIWAELLHIDRVGLHDNFFALGGHSLLATQVMSRVREILQTDLPLRKLFERPTVAGLAVSVAEAVSERGARADLASVLNELDSLSEEEAERLLAMKLSESKA